MSMYTTAQLLAANEKKFKFDPLFLRLFFRESYPFTTEKVYLSQIPGLVNMALYVSPIVSGEVNPSALRHGEASRCGGCGQMGAVCHRPELRPVGAGWLWWHGAAHHL